MADSKITGLTSFDSSNTPYWPPAPASDVIPIVDISDNTMAASGTTKKISINNLLSSSPTATGNFTITGNLTVDTNTFFVDSTNDRVGIGTATPGNKLNVAGNSSANVEPDFQINRSSSGTTIQSGPNITFVDGTTNNTTTLQVTQGRFGVWNYGSGSWNERLSVDSSGNVGIGVTPSAGAGCLQLVSGVNFPATQVASANANTLDDYEEGTFTPTVTSVGGTGIVYTPDATDSGRYTKVGRLVTFQVRLAGTYTGTFSYIRIALPFTATNSNPDSVISGLNNNTGSAIVGRTDYGSAFFLVFVPQSSGNVGIYSGFITS